MKQKKCPLWLSYRTKTNRNQWNGQQIAVNGLKLVEPPLWSSLQVVAKCWIPETHCISALQSAWCPHIDSKIQSISLLVTQLLSKALLSAESAVLDAVEIVNPSVRWIRWWIQTLISSCSNSARRLVLTLCKPRQGAQIIEEMCAALGTERIKLCDVTFCVCWIKSIT